MSDFHRLCERSAEESGDVGEKASRLQGDVKRFAVVETLNSEVNRLTEENPPCALREAR